MNESIENVDEQRFIQDYVWLTRCEPPAARSVYIHLGLRWRTRNGDGSATCEVCDPLAVGACPWTRAAAIGLVLF
jgi:hypothetical protein